MQEEFNFRLVPDPYAKVRTTGAPEVCTIHAEDWESAYTIACHYFTGYDPEPVCSKPMTRLLAQS